MKLMPINYQSVNVRGEGSWNENLWKGVKVEISDIEMIFFVINELVGCLNEPASNIFIN